MDLKTPLALALAALTIAAAPASAADLHAAPTGSGTTCSVAAPCSIQTAFGSVTAHGDAIVLAGGDYGSAGARISDQLFVGWQNVDVRAEPGARPVVWSNASNGGLVLLGANTTVSGIAIDYAGSSSSAIVGNMKSLDHVRVNSSASGIAFTNQAGSDLTVANTMVRASAEDGWGLSLTTIHNSQFNQQLTLRNATIVADGPDSIALQLMTSGQNVAATNLNVNMNNSIARGVGRDVTLQAAWGPDTVSMVVKHSNFATSELTGQGVKSITDPSDLGNQTAAPLFVNAAAGDLRQAAGSPTIDAGVDDVTPGQTDIEGDERFIGASIDIGADEFVPAPPVDNGGGSAGGDGGSGGDSGGADPNAGGSSGANGGEATGGEATGGGGQPVAGSDGGSKGSAPLPTVVPPVVAPPVIKPAAASCVVPRLSGKTLKAAKAALIKAHCAVGKVKTKRSPKKVGRVLSQTRKPGARMTAGAKIAIVVGRR